MFNKKSYVGIDIGHYAIKVVQVDRIQGGWRVTRAGAILTPKGEVRDGIVGDPVAVGGAIKQALKEAGISSKFAAISVQGTPVVVRTARMPKMAENVLRKSIRYEAGRYIPTSIEDSFVEFEILGQVDETQMDVMIVAAPRDLVESRIAACRHAGLEVDFVDVGPFAAFRSLIECANTRNWSEETLAMIDFGANTTTVSVINNGVFVMSRTVQTGSNNLTEALKTFFDLTPEDAEAGKAQLDVGELLEDSPRENPPLRVLHPYVDELVREIRRSINYYESQQVDGQPPTPVKAVVLTGGGAGLTGMDRYLGSKLGLEVTSTGVFNSASITNFTPQDLGDGLEWTVASGLAMRPHLKAA